MLCVIRIESSSISQQRKRKPMKKREGIKHWTEDGKKREDLHYQAVVKRQHGNNCVKQILVLVHEMENIVNGLKRNTKPAFQSPSVATLLRRDEEFIPRRFARSSISHYQQTKQFCSHYYNNHFVGFHSLRAQLQYCRGFCTGKNNIFLSSVMVRVLFIDAFFSNKTFLATIARNGLQGKVSGLQRIYDIR